MSIKLSSILLFSALLLLCESLSAYGQEITTKDTVNTSAIQYVWAQIEGGGGGSGAVGCIQITMASDVMLYSLRYVKSGTIGSFVDGGGRSYGLVDIDEIGLVGGFFSRGEYTMASVSAGPALVFGRIRHTDYIGTKFTTVGLSFDLQAAVKLAVIGLGIGAFGNLNFQRSYCGITVRLYLGKL